MFINKFNIVSSFRILKNVDIVFIFIFYVKYFQHRFVTFPPFWHTPHFKEIFATLNLYQFSWSHISTLKKQGVRGNHEAL